MTQIEQQNESGLAGERPQAGGEENVAGQSGGAGENAPAATEENEGRSTVLSTDPVVGVQDDPVGE